MDNSSLRRSRPARSTLCSYYELPGLQKQICDLVRLRKESSGVASKIKDYSGRIHLRVIKQRIESFLEISRRTGVKVQQPYVNHRVRRKSGKRNVKQLYSPPRQLETDSIRIRRSVHL